MMLQVAIVVFIDEIVADSCRYLCLRSTYMYLS